MNGSICRLFGRLTLLAAISGSIFMLYCPVMAQSPYTTAGEAISVYNGGTTFIELSDGVAFDGHPFTVQTVELNWYDPTASPQLQATQYEYTTTSSPEWPGGNNAEITPGAANHRYTVSVTDNTDSVSISPNNPMDIWSTVSTYNYCVYTSGPSSFGIVINNGTGGLGTGPWTMYLATTSGGTPFTNTSGYTINSGADWEFDFSSLSAGTSYYWGLSSATCTNGIATSE